MPESIVTRHLIRKLLCTHPEHTGFRSPVTGFLRYKSNRVVESVLEHAWTKARACRDAARNDHTGVEI